MCIDDPSGELWLGPNILDGSEDKAEVFEVEEEEQELDMDMDEDGENRKDDRPINY